MVSEGFDKNGVMLTRIDLVNPVGKTEKALYDLLDSLPIGTKVVFSAHGIEHRVHSREVTEQGDYYASVSVPCMNVEGYVDKMTDVSDEMIRYNGKEEGIILL